MKPILYQATETVFSSKGRGTIADAISCTVTEARNGIFDLEMQISVNSKRFSEIALDKIILAKPNPYDWPQPFRIHKITKPINGIVTVLANHISYDLKGMPVNPFTATSCSEAVAMLKSSSLITCPFTITTDIVSSTVMTVAKPYTIRDLMGGMEGSLIDTYGGEYKFNRFSVMLLSERGANRGVKIKYGINLIDLTQEENCSSVYSGVLPYFANENGIVVGDVQRASGTFAVDRILPLDLTQYFTSGYDESATLPTVAQLNTRGAAYVRNNAVGVPKVNLELSFAQLPRKEVHLCDTVTVEFEKMGIETTAKVIETVYDVLEERYRSVKLGDPRANIINSINDETEAREAANVRMQSYLEKTDSAIRAKVSKIGGDNTSFGWEMTDTSHTWYSNEEEVMKATSAGLEIKGKITATSGFIGNGSNGFTIGNTAIYNRLSSLSGNQNGIYLGTDGIALGGGKFKVTSAGALTATSADIKGKITATSGYIGNDSSGFTIGSNAIYNGMESLSDTEHNGVYIGTGGIALGKGAFKVTSSGAVTASNLSITGGTISINNGAFYVSSDGSVTAKSGTFEGNIYAKNIQYSSSNASIGTFSGAGLTDLSILEDKLRNNTISTAKTSAGINTSLGYANFANAVMNNNDTAEHISCKLLTVRGGPLIVSGRVSASYLVGVHKVLSGDNEYDMSIHTHQITEENGVVTIGAADWTGADHSFNIADTDFYKDGVSAVSVTSMIHYTEQGEQTVTWNATNHTLNASVQATLTNGNTNGSIRTVTIPADLAFDAGEASVSVSALNYYTTAGEDTVTYNSANKTLNASVQATLTNGNTTGSIRTVTIPATLAYNAGYDDGEDSVSTTGIAYYQIPGEDTVSYNSTDKTLTASVQATLTNGNTTGSIRSVTIPADLAYNAGRSAGYSDGREDGAESVTVDSVTQYSYSSTGDLSVSIDNGYLRYNNGQLVGRVNIALDGNDNTATCVVSMDGQRVVDDAKPRSIVRRTNQATGAEMPDTWDSTTNKGYIYLRATTNNGEIYVDQNIEVGVTSAIYIAGQNSDDVQRAMSVAATADNYNTYYRSVNPSAASLYTVGNFTYGLADITLVNGTTRRLQFRVPAISSSVTVDSVVLNPSVSYASKKYSVPVIATASNGATNNVTFSFDATEAYNEGTNTLVADAPTVAAHSNTHTVIGSNHYVTASINSKAHTTDFSGTTISAMTAGSLAILANQVYEDGYTAGQAAGGGGTVQTVTSIAATASNYGTYDKAIAPSFASLYTSGAYSYGLASINLSNNTSSTLRFRVPAVNDITVARPYGDMQDWDLSESNHVYVNVNLSALSNSTVLATDTGRVNVDDIVNFFATHTGAVIATDSSNYNTYDDGLTFYVQNFLYTNGNYQYARIQLRNSDGNDLSLIRIQLDKAGSSSGQITITNEATSSSVNPYYGTLPYYAFVNNKHYVYIKAVSTGVANRTQYIDINDIVNYAYALGQQSGSGSSVTVRSVKATSNKTYDSNMDMYYVMVRVTYSDGSWQNFQAWYD